MEVSQAPTQQEELYLQVQLVSIRWHFHWKESISVTDRKSYLKWKTLECGGEESIF